MKKQARLLSQLQEFDIKMDDRYKEGLPNPDKGQKLTAKQEEFHQERAEIVNQIKSRFVRYYERLRSSNIGSTAVVPISVNYACQGCFMQTTKSQVSELIKGDVFMTCEHCGRVLYLEDEAMEELQKELAIA